MIEPVRAVSGGVRVAILGIMAPRLPKPDQTPLISPRAACAARLISTDPAGMVPTWGTCRSGTTNGSWRSSPKSASGTAEEPLPVQALDMIRGLIPCDVVALIDGYPWDRVNR